MRLPVRALIPPLALLVTASCGGSSSGGGPPTPAPPPVGNRPPAFSSPGIASAPENSAGTVYTATATDPDGTAPVFAVTGGADRARFAITPQGALTFTTAPDFEQPDDAGADNVYEVQLSASDGSAVATLDLSVRVANQGPDGFRVRRVASGLTNPLFVTAVPDGSGRVFVVEKGGVVRILNPATGGFSPAPFLDVGGQISTEGERGLLGFAPAPDFATSRQFYVYLINPVGGFEVRRYRTFAADPNRADPSSADIVLSIPPFLGPPLTVNNGSFFYNNGGWIGFGPDELLYLAIGDGGGGTGSGVPNGSPQDPNSLRGKILRIDVRSDAFPADTIRDYSVPASNPFVSGGGAGEVWALGLRDPFRASFDPATGSLWVGDNNPGQVEELNLLPAGVAALNFGWNARIGTKPNQGFPDRPEFTPPVAEYSHGSGPLEGRSVVGGYVYRGPIEALHGNYFFGDLVSGNIWSIPVARVVQGQTIASSGFTQRNAAFAPSAGAFTNIASFGTDQAGNLYIVDYDGEIFVVEPA